MVSIGRRSEPLFLAAPVAVDPRKVKVPHTRQSSTVESGNVNPREPVVLGETTGGLFDIEGRDNSASAPAAKDSNAFFLAPYDFGSASLLDKYVKI